MAIGLKIINDWGTVLLDDVYPVMVIVAQGRTTLGSDGSAYIGNYPTGKVAVRCSSAASAMYFSQTDPYGAGVFLFGTPGAVVDWYVFDQSTAQSNVGLKIRNANGELMYDAGMRPARFVTFNTGTGTVSLPAGRAWAVMPINPAFTSSMTFTRQGTGDPNLFFQREDLTMVGGYYSGNDVVLAYTPQVRRQYGPYVGAVLPAAYSNTIPQGVVAVVDVTGY